MPRAAPLPIMGLCACSPFHAGELCLSSPEPCWLTMQQPTWAPSETHLIGISRGSGTQRVSSGRPGLSSQHQPPPEWRDRADARHAFHGYFYFAWETMGTQQGQGISSTCERNRHWAEGSLWGGGTREVRLCARHHREPCGKAWGLTADIGAPL